MDRREFLNWVGVGALASYLPVAIAACSNQTQSELKTDAEGFLAVGTVADLDAKGELVDKKNKIIVVRNPEDNKILAVNPECTHRQCIVDWKAEGKKFECSCHGSQFAADGKVLKDPAQKPLSSYEVKEKDNSILVKVG
ncbi:MAG: Rieske (2Fe-2S) protein [Prochloraceae cyanobacterium]|nr:Rieske (2Fe-2S) protein [Prochloraceae cyanobacterium]